MNHLDNKYAVVNRTDIDRLTGAEADLFRSLLDKIADARDQAGKASKTYLVVSSERPYAPVVERLIIDDANSGWEPDLVSQKNPNQGPGRGVSALRGHRN